VSAGAAENRWSSYPKAAFYASALIVLSGRNAEAMMDRSGSRLCENPRSPGISSG
jgi:hypothetical protein